MIKIPNFFKSPPPHFIHVGFHAHLFPCLSKVPFYLCQQLLFQFQIFIRTEIWFDLLDKLIPLLIVGEGTRAFLFRLGYDTEVLNVCCSQVCIVSIIFKVLLPSILFLKRSVGAFVDAHGGGELLPLGLLVALKLVHAIAQ